MAELRRNFERYSARYFQRDSARLARQWHFHFALDHFVVDWTVVTKRAIAIGLPFGTA
jgi:hypothetical protein